MRKLYRRRIYVLEKILSTSFFIKILETTKPSLENIRDAFKIPREESQG